MRQQTAKPDQREPEIGRVRAASQGDQARMGRYGEAEPPLDRAIALYERVGGAGTVPMAHALGFFGA